MRDDDDRLAFGIQLIEDFQHFLAARLIQRPGRLVGEDHVAGVHQSAGDGHALLLPARKLSRPVIQPIRNAKPRQQLACTGLSPLAVRAGVDGRHFDIAECGQFRKQVIALEDEAEMLAPQRRTLVTIQLARLTAGDDVAA